MISPLYEMPDKGAAAYRYSMLFLILFVVTLPLHAIEWNIFSVPRFEIKVTMITFALLFGVYLYRTIRYRIKLTKKEGIFLFFAFAYTASQFLSLSNSPIPLETIKQCMIITCLITMMFVVSQLIIDEKVARAVMVTLGIISICIATISVVHYMFFTDMSMRLGHCSSYGFFNLGGDSFYFGDLLLFSMGGMFYLFFNYMRRKIWILPKVLILYVWFAAIAMTFTKGVMLATFCFLVMALVLLKGRRLLLIAALLLFISSIFTNFSFVHRITYRPRPLVDSLSRPQLRHSFGKVSKDRLMNKKILGDYTAPAFLQKLQKRMYPYDKMIVKNQLVHNKPQEIPMSQKKPIIIQSLDSKIYNKVSSNISLLKRQLSSVFIASPKPQQIPVHEKIAKNQASLSDSPNPLAASLSQSEKPCPSGKMPASTIAVPAQPKPQQTLTYDRIAKNQASLSDSPNPLAASLSQSEKPCPSGKMPASTIAVPAQPKPQQTLTYDRIAKNQASLSERMDLSSSIGKNSLAVRKKAIRVSLLGSFEHLWVGNGAGLSQRLLPEMSNKYDKMISEKEIEQMNRAFVYGREANRSLIDSHNLFLTELFNVGIVGLVPLLGLIAFVLIGQLKIIRYAGSKDVDLNTFLFLTIITMLVFRMTGSLIVIPSLWFILGFSFGVINLYNKHSNRHNILETE